MSDLTNKLRAQTENLKSLHIVVDSETYEKTLPPKWFYATVIAGVEVFVSDVYLPISKDHFGMVLYEDETVYWLKIWE